MSDFKHSEVLFIEENGEPMKFYMRPCPEKQRLRPMIEHGGGMLTSKWMDGIHRLIPPDSKRVFENGISSKFIDDCVKQNCLIQIPDYEIKSNEIVVSDISDDDAKYQIKTSARCTRARKEYTRQDDEVIIDYVIKTKGYCEVKGRRYWLDMQDRKVLPQRTWQSLKERFIKKIIPNIHMFDLDLKQRKALLRPFGHVSSDDSTGGDEDKDFELSKNDDLIILKYLLVNDNYIRIKKDSFWQELQRTKFPHCFWMELRDRFFNTIIPSIDKYGLSLKDMMKMRSVIKIPSLAFSNDNKCHSLLKKDISATKCTSNINSNHSKHNVLSLDKNNKENMTDKEKEIKSSDTDSEKSDHHSNSKFSGISWTVVLGREPHLLCRGSLDETDNRNKSKGDTDLKLPDYNAKTKLSENLACSSSSDSSDLSSETTDKSKKSQALKSKKVDKTNQNPKICFEKFSTADIEEYLKKKTTEEENENKIASEKSDTPDSSLKILIDNLRKNLENKLQSRNNSTDKFLESLKNKKLDKVDSGLLLGLYRNEINSDSKNTGTEMSIHQDQSSMDTDDSDGGIPVMENKISDAVSGEWPETSNSFQSSIRKNGKIEETTTEHNSVSLDKLREKMNLLLQEKSIVSNSSFKNLNMQERPSKYRKLIDRNEPVYIENDFNRSEESMLSTSFPFSEREKRKNLYEALLRPRAMDPPLEIKLSSSIKTAVKKIENIKKTCQNWCQSLDSENITLPATSVNEHHEKIKALYSFVYDIYITSLSHTILKKSQSDIDENDILILLKYLITNGGFSIDDISKLMHADIQ